MKSIERKLKRSRSNCIHLERGRYLDWHYIELDDQSNIDMDHIEVYREKSKNLLLMKGENLTTYITEELSKFPKTVKEFKAKIIAFSGTHIYPVSRCLFSLEWEIW